MGRICWLTIAFGCGPFAWAANAADPAPLGPSGYPQSHYYQQYLIANSRNYSPASPYVVMPPRPVYFQEPPPPPTGFFHRMIDKAFGPKHSCEPDGCPTPMGSSSPWTEFKFTFGSATQFFGSAEATYGHRYKTTVPPAHRIPFPVAE
jgi:hypothetical protein